MLVCSSARIRPHFLGESFTDREVPKLLRVVPGCQADWFSGADFYSQEFTVQPDSNRMGLRLAGRALTLPRRELVSEPVCPGTVQVTSNGQCIVLGRDGQTIGGYPKIAQVVSADLDKLAQLRPGAPIRFERVEREAAERLFRERERDLRNWVTRLRTAAVADS